MNWTLGAKDGANGRYKACWIGRRAFSGANGASVTGSMEATTTSDACPSATAVVSTADVATSQASNIMDIEDAATQIQPQIQPQRQHSNPTATVTSSNGTLPTTNNDTSTPPSKKRRRKIYTRKNPSSTHTPPSTMDPIPNSGSGAGGSGVLALCLSSRRNM